MNIGFESADGYAVASLAGQQGWTVAQGTALVTNQVAHTGTQSAQLVAGGPPVIATEAFGPSGTELVEYSDFYAIPVANVSTGNSTMFVAEAAQAGFIQSNGQGVLQVFEANGSGGGTWVPTSFSVPINSQNQAESWVRLTMRLDFASETWGLSANGQIVASGIPFSSGSSSYFSTFKAVGASSADSFLDDLYVGPVDPFGSVDSNSNGIPDEWEIEFFGQLVGDVTVDPGGVGRTILQSYQQGLSPWPPPTVASGLQAWYRADKGLISDSVGNVSLWADLSGFGNHLSQAAGTSMEPVLVPAAMNGQPAVQFSPQQVLTSPALENFEGGGTDLTVIAVISPVATQGADSTIFSWGTDGNYNFGLSSNGTNSYLMYWSDSDGDANSTPPAVATAGQVTVLTAVKSGTTAASYLNGVSTGSNAVSSTMAQAATTLAMGNAAYPHYGFNGEVAELLVYNRALSDSERQSVEAALIAKYVNPDSNGNGIPDTWEYQYLGSLASDASSDPGGVGRTLLQSYQQGLSPWPAPIVSSGLQAWYRADLGITADSSSDVSKWVDVSGNGRHVQQMVDSSKQPLIVAAAINGQPAVQFTPQQVLATNVVQDIENGSSDITVIAVFSPAASQGYESTIFSWGADSNYVFGLSSNDTNSYVMDWDDPNGRYGRLLWTAS